MTAIPETADAVQAADPSCPPAAAGRIPDRRLTPLHASAARSEEAFRRWCDLRIDAARRNFPAATCFPIVLTLDAFLWCDSQAREAIGIELTRRGVKHYFASHLGNLSVTITGEAGVRDQGNKGFRDSGIKAAEGR